jgi:nucleoside-diphosphate-sugar epimerase
MTMKTVLVLGANGGVGSVVARAFRAHGWRVIGLVRPGKSAGEGVLSVAADLFDAKAVAAACGHVDVVFNGLNVPYPVWADKLLPTLTAAADIAEALGARHIYPGSVYNFGRHMPPRLTPETPFAPTTLKGRLRVSAEAMFRERAEAGRLHTIVVRAGDLFGDVAANSWMNALVAKDLRKGKLSSPGGYDTVHAWACLPDLAEVIVRLAEVEGDLAAYEVFHFESWNVTMRDLRAAAEQALGRRVRLNRFPRLFFHLAAPFDAFMRATLEMLYLWDAPHGLYDERLARVIGDAPRTPLDQALRYLN